MSLDSVTKCSKCKGDFISALRHWEQMLKDGSVHDGFSAEIAELLGDKAYELIKKEEVNYDFYKSLERR